MPSRKNAGKKSHQTTSETLTADAGSASKAPELFFPFARYTSIVGVHTSLLAFVALFLPRTPLSSIGRVPSFTSAGDATANQLPRDGLQILTGNPVQTVIWICLGSLILQGWWANWLRTWSLESRVFRKGEIDTGEQTQHKLREKEWAAAWPMVRIDYLLLSVNPT